ncbi:hypothetical protein OXV40_33455, partial [Burkholderia contaminans]|uniref:hypothetical protein n=1 Tax=Burkholderia contaminans TaxID=488447 RepID=UPI002D8016EC
HMATSRVQSISAFMFPLPARATRIVGRRRPKIHATRIRSPPSGMASIDPPERRLDAPLQFATAFHGHGL